MKWNLLLTDTVDQIDADSEKIVERCEKYCGREFAVYRPLPFVDHTGFTETVEEEIRFVIDAQMSSEGAHLDADTFIVKWELQPLLSHRVVQLSGGWRKFLGVSLFANRKAPAKCFLDVTSHLSDERVRMLLDRLKDRDELIAFCEYDANLMYRMAPERFLLLMENGDSLKELSDFPKGTVALFQSNYEQS
jgi:energy-coupling factor transporter ATP-binding protein EcfA2